MLNATVGLRKLQETPTRGLSHHESSGHDIHWQMTDVRVIIHLENPPKAISSVEYLTLEVPSKMS